MPRRRRYDEASSLHSSEDFTVLQGMFAIQLLCLLVGLCALDLNYIHLITLPAFIRTLSGLPATVSWPDMRPTVLQGTLGNHSSSSHALAEFPATVSGFHLNQRKLIYWLGGASTVEVQANK